MPNINSTVANTDTNHINDTTNNSQNEDSTRINNTDNTISTPLSHVKQSYHMDDYTNGTDRYSAHNTISLHSPMNHSSYPYSSIDTIRSDDFQMHAPINSTIFDPRSNNVSPMPIPLAMSIPLPNTPQHNILSTLASPQTNTHNIINTHTQSQSQSQSHSHHHSFVQHNKLTQPNYNDTNDKNNNDSSADTSKRQFITNDAVVSNSTALGQPDAKRHRASEVDLNGNETGSVIGIVYVY